VIRLLTAVLGLGLALSLSACGLDQGPGLYVDANGSHKNYGPQPGHSQPSGKETQKYTDLPVAHAPYGGCKEARRYPHTEGYRWCKRHNLLPAPKHNRFDTLGKWEE